MEVEKELVMQAEVDAKTHNELGKAKNEKIIYIGYDIFIFNRVRHSPT